MKKVELCLLNLAGRLDAPVGALLPLFAPERREAILRYRFNSDRNRTVWAELMVRRLIAEWTGVEAASAAISRDGDGRPRCSVPGVHVSLSHSGPWAACCVGRAPCGVDVEVRDRGTSLEIARRFFLPAEYLRVASAAESGGNSREVFLRYWTIKESCLKCLGLKDWSGVDCEAVISGGGSVGGRNFVLPDGAVVGVCAAGEAPPDGVRFMSAEEIEAWFGI